MVTNSSQKHRNTDAKMEKKNNEDRQSDNSLNLPKKDISQICILHPSDQSI